MAKNQRENDALLGELRAIKKLRVLGLLRSGASQAGIAATLGVTQGTISRMLPGGSRRSVGKKRKSRG